MKFQRDNSNVALTQEVKDAVVREQEEKEKAKEEFIMKKRKIAEETKRSQQNYIDKLNVVKRREFSYPPIQVQLDMLWHDMDEGKIKIDKNNANTWYQVIKKSKELTPLPSSWREDLYAAHEEMTLHTMANNNIENV